MNVSQGVVHPVEAPPRLQTEGAGNVLLPRVRMKDLQGMPGTVGGVFLRFSQLLFAVVALSVMATITDFASVTAFCLQSTVLVIISPRLGDSIVICIRVTIISTHLVTTALFLIWMPRKSIYLVAATGLQSMWSLALAIVDIYALLVGRHLQNYRAVSLFSVGDGVTSTLTFAAACASAGITVLIGNDLGACANDHCTRYETAIAMAFLSWFTALPSFLFNFWSLASR